MKSALFFALTAARRAMLMFQIRSLEVTIYGQEECLACVTDPMLNARILVARSTARRELARVRAAYNATLPVGQRRTWSMA
jgi:hypothetical protein